jgi:antitoxin HigA-1
VIMRLPDKRRPTSPGEMLREEFLNPMRITQTQFAEAIGVSYPRLNEIVNGRRGVTPDTALRFSRALGTTPEFWLNMQLAIDLWDALHSPSAKQIAKIKPLAAVA